MTKTPDRIALVMGLGRSGTTFLAKLIDSAPDVLYRHEPDAVLPTDLPSFCDPSHLEPHLGKARDYVLAMAGCRRFRSAGTLPIFKKSFRSGVGNLAFKALVLGSKAARRLKLPIMDSLPDFSHSGTTDRLTLIKSVSALGRARLFGEAVPDMTSVHIIRHPCAVYASLHRGIEQGLMRAKPPIKPLFTFPESRNYPFSYKEIANATFEEQVAFRWMVTNDKAANDMAGSPRYLRVGYEELCTDVDQVSRRIFDHFGLKIGTQTERFIDEISSTPEDSAEGVGYFDVQRSINSGIDKWKTQLDADTIERIQKIVSHSPLGRAYFEKH